MRDRAQLDALCQSLRDRQADGEALDAAEEALRLRGSGFSIIETMLVLTQGFGIQIYDAMDLVLGVDGLGMTTSDEYTRPVRPTGRVAIPYDDWPEAPWVAVESRFESWHLFDHIAERAGRGGGM